MSLENLFTVMNDQGIAQVHPVHPYILMVNHMPMPTMTTLAGAGGCSSDIQLVMQGEGYRSCMYHDTRGIPTVCYGYNLQRSKAAKDISSVGGNYSSVMRGGCLTQPQCQKLLNIDMAWARTGAQQIFGHLSCGCAAAVAVDMTYNLGTAGMKSFNQFDALMRAGRYKEAAADAQHTAWCRQVGTRCSRNVRQISMC